MPTPTSLLKKRERDRRAQQNSRDKRIAHVNRLKEHVVSLERELDTLRAALDQAQAENQSLKSRQEQIQQLVNSWPCGASSPSAAARPLSAITNCGAHARSAPELSALIQPTRRPDAMPTMASPTDLPLPHVALPSDSLPIMALPTDPTSPLDIPRWNIKPVHIGVGRAGGTFGQWTRRPDLVMAAPETPDPLDLLYGSKTNFLADVMFQGTQTWPFREPERLAVGWLTYHMIKWEVLPSEDRFSRLLDFQKPISDQLVHPHPPLVDFLPWPKLRAKLVRNYHLYDMHELMGLLTCCWKVRWPWNKVILERDESGQLEISADFYNTFTSLDGWGLTGDFIQRFPDLFDEVDKASLLYEVC